MDFEEMIVRGNRRMLLGDLELLDAAARKVNAKNIVEIGAFDGTSSLCLGTIAKENGGMLYSIEPNPTSRWKQNIRDAGLEQNTVLIMKESPWVDMRLIETPIDLLFIDGDHRTRWALVDYHYFSRFVRYEGMIAFHDWTGGKGVKAMVQRAISIILEDDALEEFGRFESNDRGIIIFKKVNYGEA